MLRTSRELSDSDGGLAHERTYLAGPESKQAAPPPRRVKVKMLRTSCESSDSDEEPEHERTYLVRDRVEQPIVDVKVDITSGTNRSGYYQITGPIC